MDCLRRERAQRGARRGAPEPGGARSRRLWPGGLSRKHRTVRAVSETVRWTVSGEDARSAGTAGDIAMRHLGGSEPSRKRSSGPFQARTGGAPRARPGRVTGAEGRARAWGARVRRLWLGGLSRKPRTTAGRRATSPRALPGGGSGAARAGRPGQGSSGVRRPVDDRFSPDACFRARHCRSRTATADFLLPFFLPEKREQRGRRAVCTVDL